MGAFGSAYESVRSVAGCLGSRLNGGGEFFFRLESLATLGVGCSPTTTLSPFATKGLALSSFNTAAFLESFNIAPQPSALSWLKTQSRAPFLQGNEGALEITKYC